MKNWKKKSGAEPLPENEVLGSEDDFAVGAGAGESATDTSEATDTGPPDTTGNFGVSDVSVATGDIGAAAIDLAGEKEKYLRLAAEYDNFRKRSAKERQDAGGRAQADLVRQLTDALDDLARFAHVDPASTDSATIVQGVDMVEKKVMKALTAAGLEVINPVDEAFNPALHEAVATEPTEAKEDDHVVSRVFQPGYVFKSQLLRPARVVVKQWTG
ncbi:MAG TPA: nucleotide exchange factor GrpE [Gemmatimonadaceae bacterium]|nr:nucleotide exchange factor GrpE [Gemmatimonadaceae bacterium]